tara:strand:- start:575 stop:1249 length:675 start_codon:yes stop_codon:yes gene_type:complete
MPDDYFPGLREKIGRSLAWLRDRFVLDRGEPITWSQVHDEGFLMKFQRYAAVRSYTYGGLAALTAAGGGGSVLFSMDEPAGLETYQKLGFEEEKLRSNYAGVEKALERKRFDARFSDDADDLEAVALEEQGVRIQGLFEKKLEHVQGVYDDFMEEQGGPINSFLLKRWLGMHGVIMLVSAGILSLGYIGKELHFIPYGNSWKWSTPKNEFPVLRRDEDGNVVWN